MMKHGLLALDLATKTGWAYALPSMSQPRSGVFTLPDTGSNVGWFLDAFERWLTPFQREIAVQEVVFEAPLHLPNSNINTARKLMSIAAMTEFVCRRNGTRYFEANNASWRKHFIGKGGGKGQVLKAMTVEACRDRGWSPRDDNEADALGLLDYAVHLRKWQPPWASGALFRESGE